MNISHQHNSIKEEGFAVYRSVIKPTLVESMKSFANMLVPALLKRHGKAGNYGYKLYRSDNLLPSFPFYEIFEIDVIYDDLISVMGEDFVACQTFLHFSTPEVVSKVVEMDKK